VGELLFKSFTRANIQLERCGGFMGWPAKKIERSADQLVNRAKKMLEKRGFFMLVFDVKGHRKLGEKIGYEEIFRRIDKFCLKVTRKYRENIIRGEINTFSYFKSFRRIICDGGGGYFNNAEIVKEIIEMAQKELAPIEMWWNVAQDIWDEKNSRIIA
jgi:hypothetical protein